jgi:hypothetical protein
MPSGEAGDPPTSGFALELLLVVGDQGPGEFVSEKHESRLRP